MIYPWIDVHRGRELYEYFKSCVFEESIICTMIGRLFNCCLEAIRVTESLPVPLIYNHNSFAIMSNHNQRTNKLERSKTTKPGNPKQSRQITTGD